MKKKYQPINFRSESLRLIDLCNETIDEYMSAGLILSLRQLYYVMVTQNTITNEERSYKNLGKLVSNARLAGMMDWEAIEDRGRQAERASEWSSISSVVESALSSYRLPRLDGQREYVELWVEKQALAGVLEPIADKYHIVLMVNKGYSSQSAMYESAQRINSNQERYGCEDSTILYLGDLDPSGEDMVRDISDRMEMFECYCNVEKVALTIEQVREYSLPPNPAKLSDSRAALFVEKYGPNSWEVDAIPPRVLQSLISETVEGFIDLETMQVVKDKEKEDKKRLRAAMVNLDKPLGDS